METKTSLCNTCELRDACYWGKSGVNFYSCDMYREKNLKTETCICCGEEIPEGWQVCPSCWVKFGKEKI